MSQINTAEGSTTHSPDTTPTVPSGRPVLATDATDAETVKALRAQVVAALRARDQAIDAQTSAEATVAAYAQQVAAQAAQIDKLTRAHAEEQRRAGFNVGAFEKYEALIAEEKRQRGLDHLVGTARLREIQILQDRLDAERRVSQGLRAVLEQRTAQLEQATRQLGLRVERDLRDTADTVPA